MHVLKNSIRTTYANTVHISSIFFPQTKSAWFYLTKTKTSLEVCPLNTFARAAWACAFLLSWSCCYKCLEFSPKNVVDFSSPHHPCLGDKLAKLTSRFFRWFRYFVCVFKWVVILHLISSAERILSKQLCAGLCDTMFTVHSTFIWAVLTGQTDWVCHIGTLTPCVEAVA